MNEAGSAAEDTHLTSYRANLCNYLTLASTPLTNCTKGPPKATLGLVSMGVREESKQNQKSTPPPPALGGSCPHQPMDGPGDPCCLASGQLPRKAGATGIEMANSFRPMLGGCLVKQSENREKKKKNKRDNKEITY